MQLDVPFKKQSPSVTCGPTSLYLVLRYFGIDITPEDIKQQSHQLSSGLTFCKGLCLSAIKNNLRVLYVTRDDSLPTTYNDYFKRTINEDGKILFETISQELDSLGVVVKKDISLQQLLTQLTQDTLVIVTLNWNLIRGKKGFGGHFVTLVGYDDNHVVVHNTGAGTPESNKRIPKDLFEKAWADKGSDKNSIFISTKPIDIIFLQ
ncbi:MAG: peptidase C39 family protein [Nanobdellota archaeon]